jgi:hypothetical protein
MATSNTNSLLYDPEDSFIYEPKSPEYSPNGPLYDPNWLDTPTHLNLPQYLFNSYDGKIVKLCTICLETLENDDSVVTCSVDIPTAEVS